MSQGSIDRLRRFEVRPNRELGQNFLVDDNILRLIGDAAELEAGDVALEVGGGLGVLSEHLAPRVAHLHVVEIDRRLEAPLRDALAPFDNVTLHLADAVELDLGALAPPPTKVVANLPYGVAATVLLRTVAELPGAGRWVAMVQREVGERLAAAPGSKTYGTTSVLAQLACEVKVLRRVPATVFHPRPNVESAIVVLRRRGPSSPGHVVAFTNGNPRGTVVLRFCCAPLSVSSQPLRCSPHCCIITAGASRSITCSTTGFSRANTSMASGRR